jgi:hypothetical protein
VRRARTWEDFVPYVFGGVCVLAIVVWIVVCHVFPKLGYDPRVCIRSHEVCTQRWQTDSRGNPSYQYTTCEDHCDEYAPAKALRPQPRWRWVSR